MKSALYPVACISLALATVVACATSGDEDPALVPPPDPVEGGTIIPDDGSAPDVVTVTDAAPSTCSDAGWCATDLPIPGLIVLDVWPLATRAFAVAATERPGYQDKHSAAKVLEWDGAAWTVIDDGSQNDRPVSPTSVWAPSDDELYYAVTDLTRTTLGGGTYGGYVYHGLRATAPATGWTWTRDRFDCATSDTPRVWGASKDEVYALTCHVIRRLGSPDVAPPDAGADADAGAEAGAPDAGTSPWGVVYADDATDAGAATISFVGATGASGDDAWFIGSRGVCAVIVRKTAAGYERIADATRVGSTCQDLPGFLNVQGGLFLGAQATEKDRLVGVNTRFDAQGHALQGVARIGRDADGGYVVDFSRPTLPPFTVTSLGALSSDDVWLTSTCGVSGGGCVLHGEQLWSDAGAYDFSTLAIRGAPNTHALSRIRGTSTTNLWAVGDERAFHKSTP